MTKATAIYVRVSHRDQKHASQLPDLERWIEANDGDAVWYKDTFTGKTMNRPGMSKLMDALQIGRLCRIVVWRLDRLGRTASGLTALFDKLVSLNVGLVSIKDGLDITTPAGRLIANVLASVAAYETEVRAERIAAGQAVARAAGKTWGGSEKGRRIKVTPEAVATIQRMKLEGETKSAMARATGLSRPTVYSVLNNGQSTTKGI